jgi:hypothetical protein
VNSISKIDIEELDKEWIDLCLSAHDLGLSTDDIRTFLRNSVPNAQIAHIQPNQ